MFKRSKKPEEQKSKPRAQIYSLPKIRTVQDGSGREVKTSFSSVIAELEKIALFNSGSGYVLPGAQTFVTPSENNDNIFLSIRTTRPRDYDDYPAYGHEELLARIIKSYEFNLNN